METGRCTSQKVSFQVFCNDQKSKMQMKYPFLSKSQIHKKIKEQWKKLDTKSKSNYTKTIYSTAKNKRLEAPCTKKAHTAQISQKPFLDNRKKSVKERVDLEPDQDENTEMKSTDTQTNNLDCYCETSENAGINRETTKQDLKEKPCRKTVPWKGRPSLGNSDLWSDSSPDRVSPKKAKMMKKQKEKVQGILKPKGYRNESRPLKSKNRVSFGSPQNTANTLSPGHIEDCSTSTSDEDNAQLLHRTDEDIYDFERIDNYELCVEEDTYSNLFKPTSDCRPNVQLYDSKNEDTYDKNTCIPDFKVPQSMDYKKKGIGDTKSNKREDKPHPDNNLLSPMTGESAENSPADFSTPMEKEKKILDNSLVTPQMHELSMQKKLEVANKTPKKNKAHFIEASIKDAPDVPVRSTRRSLSSETRQKSSDKENSDSESLSVTPLTESVASGSESFASHNFQAGELDRNELSAKTRILESMENDSDPDELILKWKSTRTNKKHRRKRKAKPKQSERLKNLCSPNSTSSSDSALQLDNKRKPRMPKECKKQKSNLEQMVSTQVQVKGKNKTQIGDKNSPSRSSEESKIVKSPIGRMDADRLISESSNEISMDYAQNSPLPDSCLYLNEDLGSDSNSSSFMIDKQPTNKVLLSAIFKMQQAVQYQDRSTSDYENGSPHLNESATWMSENDSVLDERLDVEEEDQSTICKDQNSLNFICESEAGSCTETSGTETMSENLQQSEAFIQEQDPIQTDTGDKDLQSDDKDIHKDNDQKLQPPGAEVHSGEDVFQMFSKPVPSTTPNLPSKRFICSAQEESRSNFTDLFHEDDIF